MIKKILLDMLAAMLLLITIGCGDDSLPVYEMTEDSEKGMCVIIDGVQYQMYPETKWHASQIDYQVIGYAGSKRTKIIGVLGDVNRNFILLDEPGFWDKQYPFLYRADIPEPSALSVDEVFYREQDFRGEEAHRYSATTRDKEIIESVFEILDSQEKTKEVSSLLGPSISLSCLSDDLPGVAYILGFRIKNGKLMCGNYHEGYVEFPRKLLEEIAGRTVDIYG